MLLEKALDVGSRICIKLSSTSTLLFNKWLHVAANIAEEHTSKKCSPYTTAPRVVSKYLLNFNFQIINSYNLKNEIKQSSNYW